MKKEYVYKRFERFWHWTQTGLIIFLALTGFEIHGSIHFFGFGQAVRLHALAANAFLVLIVFAIFWHITTGEWRQYIPTVHNLRTQLRYYGTGIFHDAPHPFRKTVLSKLNPLQKLVYAGLKVLIIPLMVVSGLLYEFYRYPQRQEIDSITIGGLEIIALIHTAGAFLMLSFVIAHVYLLTTGRTLTSNLKAMITGYEEIDDATAGASIPGESQ